MVDEFTRGSEGSAEPARMNVLLDDITADAEAMLSHPTSSGRILWNAELSNFAESFHGHTETIHSTGSSHAARFADACESSVHMQC